MSALPSAETAEIESLARQAEACSSPSSRSIIKTYAQTILARLGVGIKDQLNLVTYDDELRRSADEQWEGLKGMAKGKTGEAAGGADDMLRDNVIIAESIQLNAKPEEELPRAEPLQQQPQQPPPARPRPRQSRWLPLLAGAALAAGAGGGGLLIGQMLSQSGDTIVNPVQEADRTDWALEFVD